MAGRISFYLAVLAIQISCVVCRNDFYHYFFSLHHRSSTTKVSVSSLPLGSTTELPNSLSTTGSTPETKNTISETDTWEFKNTRKQRSNYDDIEIIGGESHISIGTIISIAIGSLIIIFLVILCCILCRRRRITHTGFIIRENMQQQQPEVPTSQSHIAQDIVYHHQPPQQQIPLSPPPYDTQPVPQQFYPNSQQSPALHQQFQQNQQPIQMWTARQPQPPLVNTQNSTKASAPPYLNY